MRQTAKLFLNGRSQAVRLPARFRFKNTDQVYIDQLETGELLLSSKPDNWDSFFALFNELSKKDVDELKNFMSTRDLSPPQQRDIF
jgi:antitoxin VapB